MLIGLWNMLVIWLDNCSCSCSLGCVVWNLVNYGSSRWWFRFDGVVICSIL